MSTTLEPTTKVPSGMIRGAQKAADRRSWRLMLAGLIVTAVVACVGWATAGYLYFFALPDIANAHKVAYTLELVDRFSESPAHQVYMQLSDDMKPWWEAIEDMQRQIAATTDDDAREKLISNRDATLIAFIREHYLANRIDMLINAFGSFKHCLDVDACDDDALRKSIAIDVKRIYRTFRPYIEFVRASGKHGADEFGKDLEGLFFRFAS
jgi:hypothetical protein